MGLSLLLALAAAGTTDAQQAPAPNAPPVTAGDKTYRIFAEVITSGEASGLQGVGCVSQTVFFPGDAIVFRAVIADGPSGTPLSAADVARLGLAATVTLSDGSKAALRLGMHPPPPQVPVHSTYWSGAIKTAPDHPTGTLKWTLTVTDRAGAKVTFEPMGQVNNVTVLTLAPRAPAAK